MGNRSIGVIEATTSVLDPFVGQGIQTLSRHGQTKLARIAIVVIVLPEEDGWIGVNAWKANSSDQRRYWKEAS